MSATETASCPHFAYWSRFSKSATGGLCESSLRFWWLCSKWEGCAGSQTFSGRISTARLAETTAAVARPAATVAARTALAGRIASCYLIGIF